MSSEDFIKTKLEKLLNEYADSHQNKTNIRIHLFAIPIIMFSLLGLLKALPVPESWPLWFDWSSILIIFAALFYCSLKSAEVVIVMAIVMAIMLSILEFLRPHFFVLCFFLFVLAWIFQFIGHKIEGKKPAFFKDLFFLFIGPLWVLKHLKENFNNAKDT